MDDETVFQGKFATYECVSVQCVGVRIEVFADSNLPLSLSLCCVNIETVG